MPKDSRSRVNAVREVMAETGLRYTQAAAELDRRTGTADDRQQDPEPNSRLQFVPFIFAFTAPADADRRALAQGLADQLHTLHRETTGEAYDGRADVVVPARDWERDPQHPGHVSGILLVRAWAVRDWDRPGEWEAVVTDFYDTAKAWLLARHPAPAGHQPAAMPVGEKEDKALSATAEFTAHTQGAHGMLPAGWQDLITARAAEAPTAPAAAENSVVMVPSASGGLEKASAAYELESQGDLTVWRPASPPTEAELPYRVVDASLQGWYRRSGDGRYDADSGQARGLETMAYEDLAAARGPLRPVEPPSTLDSDAVRAALAGAGRKAAASLLVAVFRLTEQDARARRTQGAKSWLLAGREGSNEAASLDRLAWGIGCDLAEKPKRYDAEAVDVLVRVIEGWVTGSDRYVEVAANLAWLFSGVADEAGGWAAVADQYLQRHARVGAPDHVVEAVQLYLMSQSRTFFA
ncbi:hypothetical protein ACFC0S_15885 [Streptomyces sp. NPDC056084]|uniref:hypothetical protein n=1 Tax=unclassified Streptomyces TaxID=2593676 RepID=UPI0035DE9843